MKSLHINPKNQNSEELNKFISNGKHVFVIVYMVGCGPCNSTRPEWEKIEESLDNKFILELYKEVKKLDKKGVKWLMTQADTKEIKDIFKEYKIKKFEVYRANSKTYKNELIIMNY